MIGQRRMSKPCGRPGCTTLILMISGPKEFTKRKYCGNSCSARHKHQQGRSHHLTFADRSRAGHAGKVTRRKQMLERVWNQVRGLIDPKLEVHLSSGDLARVRYAVVRAFLMGEHHGQDVSGHRRWKQKQGAA